LLPCLPELFSYAHFSPFFIQKELFLIKLAKKWQSMGAQNTHLTHFNVFF
jgi:hypothetical protein